MKKTKPIKIILPTEGEKAAMASKLRAANIIPGGDENPVDVLKNKDQYQWSKEYKSGYRYHKGKRQYYKKRSVPAKQKAIEKPGKSLVKTYDPLDTPIPVPKFVKPENNHAYTQMIIKVCQIDFDDIAAFARDYTVSRQTIYNWLRHQDTKDLIDEVIKAIASADKPKVYQMILSQVSENAAYARLWAERYEDYQPKAPSTGNVTINFNFLDPPAEKKPAKETEYEEIEEE